MFGETVIHIRPGAETGRDRYNKPVFGTTSKAVDGVTVEPAGSKRDPQTGQTITTTGFTLYLPSSETVDAGDRFTVRGKTYQVEGKSSDWVSPFTQWAPTNAVVLEESEFIGA